MSSNLKRAGSPDATSPPPKRVSFSSSPTPPTGINTPKQDMYMEILGHLYFVLLHESLRAFCSETQRQFSIRYLDDFVESACKLFGSLVTTELKTFFRLLKSVSDSASGIKGARIIGSQKRLDLGITTPLPVGEKDELQIFALISLKIVDRDRKESKTWQMRSLLLPECMRALLMQIHQTLLRSLAQ